MWSAGRSWAEQLSEQWRARPVDKVGQPFDGIFTAVHLNADGTGEMITDPLALASIYRAETDEELREAVIQAFFVQGNARALIDIAKTEKNRDLRNEALQKLSVMNNKEARDYLLQFLDD